MRRGWEVEYSYGTIINEEQMNWKSIPKFNIIRLTLHYDGRQWDIHNKEVYIQKKGGSVVPGVADSFQIESRSIGFYDTIDSKTYKVWYTVNEFTGKMNISTKDI